MDHDTLVLRPLYDRLVVQPMELATRKGSLIIPESAQERPQIGLVVAAGEGRVTAYGAVLAMRVRPGDRVLYARHCGSEVEIEGQALKILREDEVFAVLDEVPAFAAGAAGFARPAQAAPAAEEPPAATGYVDDEEAHSVPV